MQLAPFQELAYGEMSGAPSDRTEQLDAVMQGAGFDARLSRTIEREMWEKWVLLATLGGITCLMRGNVGEIEAAGRRSLRARSSWRRSSRWSPRPDTRRATSSSTTRVAILTAKGSTQTSSMYRDLQQGRPIEADQIIGDLLAHAHRLDVPTPLLAAAYTHLSIYQGQVSS